MRLSYVAVVCFGFVLAAYSHPKKHTDNRNEDKQPAINTSSPEEQCTSRQTIQDPSHHDAHSGSRTVRVVSLPARDWLDNSAILINGIIAVTGVGGILLAIGTLWKIERQTKATEIQAAHLVESARPFLMIEVLGDENNASFQVCNRGISPAKILFINRLLLPTYLPIGKSLPMVPDYGQQYRNTVDFSINAEPVNAEWVSPAGQTFIGTVFPKSELALLRSASPHTQIGPSVVWHFGVVVYKGLFGPKCYES